MIKGALQSKKVNIFIIDNYNKDAILQQIITNQIKCWFLRRGENRSTRRKTSRSRVENQQTQPTYDTGSGNRTRATLVEGECSHHCANPAPIVAIKVKGAVSPIFSVPLNRQETHLY